MYVNKLGPEQIGFPDATWVQLASGPELWLPQESLEKVEHVKLF